MVLALLLALSPGAVGSCMFSPQQRENLHIAWVIGASANIGTTLQVILLNESSAKSGLFIGDRDKAEHSLGAWQVTLKAARRAWPPLNRWSNTRLAHKLIYDRYFNGRIAADYFIELYSTRNWVDAISAYNGGPQGSKALHTHYVQEALHWLACLQSVPIH